MAEGITEKITEKTFFSALLKAVKNNKLVTGAVIYLVLVIVVSMCAPILPISGPNEGKLINSLTPPSFITGDGSGFLFGTDMFGRDILSRIIYGARTSLSIALLSTALSMAIGTILGMVAGYIRSMDMLISRIVDVQLAFPPIVLAIVIVAALGSPSAAKLVVVMTIRGWVGYTRIVRSLVLTLRESLLIESSRCIGCSKARIIFIHLLPNVISSAVAVAIIQIPQFIIQEASLSFMGLGIPISQPSWGGMLQQGQQVIYAAWWPIVFPAIAISSIVFAGIIVGNKVSSHFERA